MNINLLFIEKLHDKVVINLSRCLRCKNLIEEFRIPMEGESAENILYNILQDREKNFQLKFQEVQVQCPQCHNAVENVTYFKASPEELELLNNTPLANILLTVR